MLLATKRTDVRKQTLLRSFAGNSGQIEYAEFIVVAARHLGIALATRHYVARRAAADERPMNVLYRPSRRSF